MPAAAVRLLLFQVAHCAINRDQQTLPIERLAQVVHSIDFERMYGVLGIPSDEDNGGHPLRPRRRDDLEASQFRHVRMSSSASVPFDASAAIATRSSSFSSSRRYRLACGSSSTISARATAAAICMWIC